MAALETRVATLNPGTAHVYAETDPAITTASADIAAPLQALLNANKKVEFRGQGTYLSGPVTVPAGTTLIIPDGVTLKLKHAVNADFLTNNGRIVGDGTIDGNKVNQTSGSAVVMPTAGARIKGVTVTNAKATSVYINATGCQAIRVTVTNGESFGIWDRLGQCLIEGCTVTTCIFAGIRTNGFTGFGNRRTRILGNTVTITDASTICIELWAEGANLSSGATVQGNVTSGGYMGISLDRQHSATVTGNTVSGPSTIGLELASSVDCTLSGNTVDGLGTLVSGIGCSNADNARNTITANTVRGWTATGVHVYQGSRYTISSNVLLGPGIGSGKTIWLQQTNRITVTGNILENVNIPVQLEDSSTVTMTGNTLDTVGMVFELAWIAGGPYDRITFIGNTIVGAAFGIYLSTAATNYGSQVVIRANPNDIGMPDYLDFKNDVQDRIVTATPEGAIAAGIGSRAIHRTTGAVYRKTSGTGNVGWVTP